MTVNIAASKPRKVDFDFDGQQLYVRKMSLELGLKLQVLKEGDDIPAELIAEIVAACVVNADGEQLLTTEEVLGFDLEPMLRLFSEVSDTATRASEAEKN